MQNVGFGNHFGKVVIEHAAVVLAQLCEAVFVYKFIVQRIEYFEVVAVQCQR